MRMASPSVAIPAPTRTVALVGLASQNANTPNRKPRVTRQRANSDAASDMVGARAETTLDCLEYFVGVYVCQTHPLQLATAQVMTRTDIGAGHCHVGRHPRSISRRSRWTENADHGSADCSGDVRRAGISRHNELGTARQGDEIANRRWRCHDRRTRGVSGHLFSQAALSFSPQCDRGQAMTIAQRSGDEAEARGRPPFVRPRRPRVQQHVADSSSFAHRARNVRLDVLNWEFRIAGVKPKWLEQPKIDLHDVSCFARIVDPAAAGIVDVSIERPSQLLAQIRRRESNHATGARAACESRGLKESLEINGNVVSRPPQLADRTEESQVSLRVAIQREAAIENRHQGENLAVLGADQPVDPGGRKRPTKRCCHRNRMNDVAQRAEAYEKDAVHPWRVRRATTSRVEWCFSSPTMTVRPP